MFDLSWEPRIMRQLDIPHYQDPWDSGRQPSRPETRKNTIINIYCRDIFTGQNYFFETIQSVCDYFGYTYDTVYKDIAQKILLSNRYFLTLDENESKTKKFTAVIVTDNKTGITSKARSIGQYCQSINMKTSNFAKWQKSGRCTVQKVEL